MAAPAPHPSGFVQVLIPIVVFAIIFALRARRMSRMRPLRLEQLWIVPAIYLLLVVVTFVIHPPSGFGWATAAAGLVVGGVLGWLRGKTVRIHVDPETHALNQQASPLGMLLLLVIVGGRMVARTGGQAANLDLTGITDALLGLALGVFAMMRLEMYLRGKRLLAAEASRRA